MFGIALIEVTKQMQDSLEGYGPVRRVRREGRSPSAGALGGHGGP